jgi:glutamate synthase (ferredoxin)
MPRWSLAQPFRFIAHNGEINTFLANINNCSSRENQYQSEKLNPILDNLKPIVGTKGSDSCALDNMVELLIKNGAKPQKALAILLPEAYKDHPIATQKKELIDFYDYHAGMQEPWDGPANVTCCDGRILCATLDRNGLRPARYDLTEDGYVYFGSEIGSNTIP